MLASILIENLRLLLAFHQGRNVQARRLEEAAAAATAPEDPEAQRRRLLRRSGEAARAAAAALAGADADKGWRQEARSRHGDLVESRRVPGRRGKVFRLTATFPDTPPARLWEEVKADTERPGWFLERSRTVEVLPADGADGADVLLQRSAAHAGGLVPGREFLLVRRWGRLPGGGRLLAVASADHSAAPPSPADIRGDCGPGGWLVEAAGPGGGGARLRWVLDCALGGWLPVRLLDSRAPASMLEYTAELRARFTPGQTARA